MASGIRSTAFGDSNITSGTNSTAFGHDNIASGNWSTAFGFSNSAIGNLSVVWGQNNTVNGSYSTSFGFRNTSKTFSETVLGIGATEYTSSANGDTQFRTVNATDRLFVVGNAIDTDNDDIVDTTERRDALIILKNGLTRLPSTTNAIITAADGKAVVTKEYLQSNTSAWGLTGNAGTNSATNFIGTSDDKDVVFKRNNINAGLLDTSNTSFGVNALNTRFGNSNTGVGRSALEKNTTGASNSAYGAFSLSENLTGGANTANGVAVLYFNTSGNFNTGNGVTALNSNTIGNENTSLGYQSDVALSDLNNATAIGSRAMVGASNSLVLGSINGVNGATATVNVGIGTTIPLERLHVVGKIRMVDGSQAAGRVLTCDANGTGVWNTFSATNAWRLGGNIGTNSTINFIGTSDNQDVIFKRNNIRAGFLDTSNSSFGVNALNPLSTGSNNSAIGVSALDNNTTGGNNTANGFQTLRANTTGTNNTANGVTALDKNTTGDDNVAMGSRSLTDNVIGNSNTAIGKDALFNSISNNNTAVGRGTLSGVTTGDNNTAIGFDAQVANAAGDNQVRIGNGAVVSARVQVAWTITSDNRWKSNIQKSNLGLEFIKELNPVFYTRKDVEVNNGKTIILETTTNPTTEYGFIAQELESSLNKFNAKDNGIISKDDAGMLGVRYNDLLAPMVKAIQEQQVIIEAQAKTITTILERLQTLENKK